MSIANNVPLSEYLAGDASVERLVRALALATGFRVHIEIRRRLALGRPEALLPDLARNLTNLGMMLSDLGRHEEALAATSEAVEIARELSKARPEVFRSALVWSLTNMKDKLANVGRHDDAKRVAAELDALSTAAVDETLRQ